VNRHTTLVRTAVLAAFGVIVVMLVAAPAAPAAKVSQVKARLRAVEARLSDVALQSQIAVEKYNQATSRLDSVEMRIDQNQRLLDAAEQNLRTANKQLTVRAQTIYKSRDISIVDVLFQADSFDELITQLDMMNRIGNSDVDTVKAIAAYRRDIKDRRVKLKADQKAAAKLVAQSEQHKIEIIALEGRLQNLTENIKKQIHRLKAQARLRAQLALTGYSGPIPQVDPNSPGRPEVVAIAQRYLGVPYVWGGTSPSGFDCSGLVIYCFAQLGVQTPRGATDQQRASLPVPLSELKPGDLVFFGNAGFSHHVAISLGGATIIEAPYTGAVVRYGTWTGRDAWIGGRF
jgi:cell wall-associated NlpC family hydrolase